MFRELSIAIDDAADQLGQGQKPKRYISDGEGIESNSNSECGYSDSGLSCRYYHHVFWLKLLVLHAEGKPWQFISDGSCGDLRTPSQVASRRVTKLITSG